MAFALTDDERLIRDTVLAFAHQIGLEQAAKFDRFDEVPVGPLQEAAGLGLMSFASPEGPGPTAFALAIDALAQVCSNTAALVAAHTAAGRILGPVAPAGELAALLISEEANGSDIKKHGTLATRDGDGWRLTGQKAWIIGAAAAKHFAVLANVPQQGLAWFHVPADSPGVTLGQNDPIMGLRASGIRTVYLYNVRLPAGSLLSPPGQAVAALADAQAWLKVGIAAALNGATAGGATVAKDFAAKRIQFNAPIATYQAVSDGITEIDIQVEASRALTLAAAATLGTPEAGPWAARAKAFAASMAIPMTRQAIRVMGGTGFMREGGSERFARDVRALQFVGETIQMQKDLLKRHLLPDVAFPATP